MNFATISIVIFFFLFYQQKKSLYTVMELTDPKIIFSLFLSTKKFSEGYNSKKTITIIFRFFLSFFQYTKSIRNCINCNAHCNKQTENPSKVTNFLDSTSIKVLYTLYNGSIAGTKEQKMKRKQHRLPDLGATLSFRLYAI